MLNVKADPILIGSLLSLPGYFPAYHMNKENWISILLEESDLDKNIRNLLQMSYELTGKQDSKTVQGEVFMK